jgi:hypothetical protein
MTSDGVPIPLSSHYRSIWQIIPVPSAFSCGPAVHKEWQASTALNQKRALTSDLMEGIENSIQCARASGLICTARRVGVE